MRGTWVLAVAGACVAVGCLIRGRAAPPASHAPATAAAPPAAGDAAPPAAPPSIFHAEPLATADASAGPDAEPPTSEAPPPALAGLDLSRMTRDAAGFTARTDAGVAKLTVTPDLQHTAVALMAARHLREAAAVLMDVATGRLLVYASHVEKGAPRDLCAEARAPSASVFKIVTAAALIEDAHLGPDTRQCYSGGESRITAADLVDNPRRDRQCATLAGALGRSINTVFARLAGARLSPPQLEAMAHRFGYGRGVPFDVPVEPSSLHVPTEPLEFARTAAGFWNSTLSPLEAAEISAIVARGGETVRPAVVDEVRSSAGAVVWSAPEDTPRRRVVARETAEQLATMMDHTVSEGTSWHAFHDARGRAYLPGIPVAGKTGTLTDAGAQRFYTWFTGFAPARPAPGVRQVAVAVLVVNGPTWEIKANVLAREVLRAYFASQGAPGVTRPGVVVAKRRARRG